MIHYNNKYWKNKNTYSPNDMLVPLYPVLDGASYQHFLFLG